MVDEIGQMNFEGNILPQAWFQHPLLFTDSGTINLPAIIILADIIYWYRPTIVRDEVTGEVTRVLKKFRYRKVYKDYKIWAASFGLTKRQVQDAIAFLKRRGLITVEITPFQFEAGVTVGTVVFIEPIPVKIREITFGVTPLTFKSDPPSEEAEGHGETGEGSRFNGTHLTSDGDPSTDTTAKTFTDLVSQQQQTDDVDVVESIDSATVAPDRRPRARKSSAAVMSPKSRAAAAEQVVLTPAVPTSPAPQEDDLVNRLLEHARTVGRELSQETAVRIIAQQPVATMTPGQLFDLVTQQADRVSLAPPLPKEMANTFAFEQSSKLRWHLITWPGHQESKPEYWEGQKKKHTRTSCFLHRYKNEMAPPVEWLDRQIREDTARRRETERAAAQASAALFWETVRDRLTPVQRSQVHEHVAELVKTRMGIFSVHPDLPEYQVARASYLNDPDVRERLQAMCDAPAAVLNAAPAAGVSPGTSPAAVPMTRRPNFAHVARRIRSALASGELTLDTVDAHRERFAPGWVEAEWQDVKSEAVAKLAAAA